MENSMKSTSKINPAIMEIRNVLMPKRALSCWFKSSIMVYHYASFRFQFFEHYMQQSKQRITLKAPLPALQLPKSRNEAITHAKLWAWFLHCSMSLHPKMCLFANHSSSNACIMVLLKLVFVLLCTQFLSPLPCRWWFAVSVIELWRH